MIRVCPAGFRVIRIAALAAISINPEAFAFSVREFFLPLYIYTRRPYNRGFTVLYPAPAAGQSHGMLRFARSALPLMYYDLKICSGITVELLQARTIRKRLGND